jgi:Sap-like sulfolipid-1-addressing protein
VLLLSCNGGLAKATAFAIGWLTGVAAVATLLTALVERAGLSEADPLWISGPETALGGLFLVSAGAFWLRCGRRVEEPRWLEAVDALTPGRSGGLGIVVSGANPKVVALALGAALALGEAGASAPRSAAALGLFAWIGTLGVALPVGVRVAAPARTDHTLQRMRVGLTRHDNTILGALALVLGLIFVVDGVGGV